MVDLLVRRDVLLGPHENLILIFKNLDIFKLTWNLGLGHNFRQLIRKSFSLLPLLSLPLEEEEIGLWIMRGNTLSMLRNRGNLGLLLSRSDVAEELAPNSIMGCNYILPLDYL